MPSTPTTAGLSVVPQPPSAVSATSTTPPPAAGAPGAPARPSATAVSVSLTSIDPPLVAEYAELTPGSTGPVVTALSARVLATELTELRADAAAHAAAAEGAPRTRVNAVA